nr:uncharacterized protein LOC123770711 [Procambarus clarkii]
MAYWVVRTALLMALVACSLAAVAIGISDINPEYPNMCWVAKANKAYPPGTQWQEPHCTRAACTKNRSRLTIEYATCGVMGDAPLGCRKVQNLSLPYPHCCPDLSCDKTEATKEENNESANSIDGKLVPSA